MAGSRAESPFLIAFVDLTRFGSQSQRVSDGEIADTLDQYYRHVTAAVEQARGRVVKFIGDAALVVFPEDAVDRGIETLLALKASIDRFMAGRGWDCRLTAKAHYGVVVAGPFGPPEAARFDVIGKAVNTAAMLDGAGVTLSVAAFRRLSPHLRRRFKKHTPPVTYIRSEDPHR
jgi:adenylate cyclase